MSSLAPVTQGDIPELVAFLREVDLTRSGVEASTVRLWIERDRSGAITASTGFELSEDWQHALIRSVAVTPSARREGHGSRLATYALARACEAEARNAWLFSRRSGPFWEKLGFQHADRDDLARVLSNTQQVGLFAKSGQLGQEIAWYRALSPV